VQIVLLGYMGSGKSSIGLNLGEALNIKSLDLDDYIESQEGTSISNIFKDKGEIYFRKKEAEYLRTLLLDSKEMVLSLGGGTPCYANNMDAINKHTPNSFYLNLSVLTLLNRLSTEKEKRPLIAQLSNDELTEFIGKHLFERSFFYTKASNTIRCGDKSIAEITEEIRSKLI